MNISIQNLLLKYRTGSLDNSEISYILSITQCNELDEAISILESIYDLSGAYKSTAPLHVNHAWENFERKVFQNNHDHHHTEKKSPLALVMMTTLVLTGISLVIYFYAFYDAFPVKLVTQKEYFRETNLADNSTVIINKSSVVEVSANFDKKNREVRLTGEAFFKVKPDKTKPFIIEVNQGKVIVLGTSFNIESIKNSDSVSIHVKTGKVKFVPAKGDKEYQILPDEKFVYHQSGSDVFVYKVSDKNADYWVSKKIQFESTQLNEVLKKISHLYDVEYKIENPATGRCRFTGFFDNYTLEQVHNILETVMGISISKTGTESYLIKGEICQ